MQLQHLLRLVGGQIAIIQEFIIIYEVVVIHGAVFAAWKPRTKRNV